MYSAIKILLLIGLNFYQVHSLEPMDVNFWLYTNENLKKHEDMVFDGEKATIDSDTKFDPTRPTKVIAHGLGGGIKTWVRSFAKAYSQVGVDYNIIGINWRSIKKGKGWDVSLGNVGKYTAHFLQDLVKNHGLKIEDVHCIGFSFGTDVIHTSKLGLLDRLGHIDFYPNGGENQPCTCEKSKKPCPGIKCKKGISWYDKKDHNRAPAYYEESILNPKAFVAWKCPSSMSFKKWKNMGVDRKCSSENSSPNLAHMGECTTSSGFPEGIYYLTTKGKSPYSSDEMM